MFAALTLAVFLAANSPIPQTPARGVVVASGGFSPPSGNTLWLDAANVDDPVDGQPVATWTDSSGSGNHATQADAGKKPTYKTGIVNGLPVVRFDGSADYVQSTCTDYATIFAVLNMTTLATDKSFMGAASSSGGNWDAYLFGTTSDNDTPYLRVGIVPGSTSVSVNGANGGIVVNQFSIMTVTISGSLAMKFWQNGTAGTTSSTADTPQGNLQHTVVGAGRFAGNIVDWWPGDIAEVMVFNSALSAANLNSVGNYLGTKYAITWNTIP